MIKSAGKNCFRDNRFDRRAWSADILQTPEEVRKTFAQLGVAGQKITHLRAIGRGYDIGVRAWEEPACQIGHDDMCDENTPLSLTVEFDEPLLITLSNSVRFEINFSEPGLVRMSKNCLPPDIAHGCNVNNFDAARLFSRCLGRTIVGLETKGAAECPFTYYGAGSAWDNLPEYIVSAGLFLDDGAKLVFEAWFDYGVVTAVNADDEPLSVSLAEMRRAVTLRDNAG